MFQARSHTVAYGETETFFQACLKIVCVFGRMVYKNTILKRTLCTRALTRLNTLEVHQMYGTHTLAFKGFL